MIEGNSFILQLEYGILREICQNLDVESKWRDLVAAADGSRFQLQSVLLTCLLRSFLMSKIQLSEMHCNLSDVCLEAANVLSCLNVLVFPCLLVNASASPLLYRFDLRHQNL